jgi:hypothetical protein
MKVNSDNKYPRVLIISHNPLSDTQNNGKTLSAFFKQWDFDNLAQLYLTTDIPDFSICNKFYQIHDFDILKRAFLNKSVQGRRITYSASYEMKKFKKKIKNSLFLKLARKNITPLFQFLRDLLWNVADYKTHDLIRFVDEFNPQVVFFQSSSGLCAFSLAKWICQSRNIPLVMHTTDDYVSGLFTLDPFFWIQHIRLERAYKWAVSYSDCIVASSEKMAIEYRLRFGGNYFVAQNSIHNPHLPKYIPVNDKIQFVYAGNLGLDRWKILALIAECFEELHNEEGFSAELSTYSLVEPEKRELLLLNRPPFSYFKGALNTDELNAVFTHSDVLVHVEAFDRKNRHITRLSTSTKIPEYLASGRCIFAVGPNDVSSMQYLAGYDLGVTVMSNNKSKIKLALRDIIINSEKRIKYAEKGKIIAEVKHNADKTAESIYQIISASVTKRHI